MRRAVRFIGRCRACERAAKRDGAKRPLIAVSAVRWRETQTDSGYCNGIPWRRSSTQWYDSDHSDAPENRHPGLSTCRHCGKTLLMSPVAGTLREDVPCSAKCTGATGHVCDCACGGLSHGAAHQ